MTTVPETPRLDDWNIELVNLSDGSTFILRDEIISVRTVTEPGATRRKLLSGQLECSAGTSSNPSYAAQSLGWGGWQAIRFVPYADTSQEFWGLIAKQQESYSNRPGKIPLTLAPIGYLLHSRIVYHVTGGAAVPISGASLTVDDYAKKLVRYSALSGTVTNDLDGNSRNWNWGTLAVQADASASSETFGVGHTGIDEFKQFLDDVLNALINVDLEFYWELLPSVSGGTITFTFNTSCSVGTDRTSGANRWVINDFAGEEPTGERQEDKIGMYNAQHTGGLGHIELDAASIASYGRWESFTDAQEDEGAKEDLRPGLPKIGHKVSYAVTKDWMAIWNEGDRMLRNNVRLGIAESSERLAEVHMTAGGSDKLIRLDLVWGDREAQQTKNKRGGRGGKLTPREVVYPARAAPVSVGGANSEGSGYYIVRNDHVHKLTLSIPTPATVSPSSGDFSLESADASITYSTPGAGRIDLSVGPGGGIAPADAPYVVVDYDGDLTAERKLTEGTAITITDAGAGSTITIAHAADASAIPNAHHTNYWARNGGSAYLYPATNDDDVRLQAAGPTDTIWLEADSGESHFAGSMYLGSASTNASQRLHLYAGGSEVWMREEGPITAELGVSSGNLAVWRTLSNVSHSIQPNSSEVVHINSTGVYIVSGTKIALDKGVIGTGNWSWYADPVTPQVYHEAGMHMTWEGTTYQMPTDAPAAGEALTVKALGALNTLEWSAPAPGVHDIVGAQHTITGAQYCIVGATALNTLGLLTPSYNIQAGNTILISNASGQARSKNWQLTDGTWLSGGIENNGQNSWYLNVDSTHHFQVGVSSFIPVTNDAATLGDSTHAWAWMNVTRYLAFRKSGSYGIYHIDSGNGPYLRLSGSYYQPGAIQAGDIPDISATYVPVTRTVTAGAGLTGGGALNANITLDVGAGTAIQVNANSIELSHLGIEDLADPGADRVYFWDDTASKSDWLSMAARLVITGTTLDLQNLGVAAGPIGDATHVSQVTIDNYGRVTALSSVAITGTPPAVHEVEGAYHTISAAQYSLVGATALNTLGVFVATNAPGGAVAMLRTDGSGYVRPERLELGSANVWVGYDTAVNLDLAAGSGGVIQFFVVADEVYQMSATAFRADDGQTLGTTAKRWGDAYFGAGSAIHHSDGDSAGYILHGTAGGFVPSNNATVGSLTISTGSLTVSVGNIVVAGNVDGVKVSTHTHRTTNGRAISTGTYTPGGHKDWSPLKETSGPTELYVIRWTSSPGSYTQVRLSDGTGDAGAAWVTMAITKAYIEGIEHTHVNATHAWGYEDIDTGAPL